MDFAALDLARLWGRDPDWFFSLSHANQVQLLAYHRVLHSPAKPPKD